MKYFIVAFPLFLLITSCSEQMESQNNSYESVDIIQQESIQAGDSKKDEAFEPDITSGSITLEFTHFDFTIIHHSIYKDRIIDKQTEDTIQLYLDLGEYLDSAIIEIHHGGLYNIDIYQMYENSLTINNEGPHCDLVDWEHYYSDWVAIKKHNNYDFVAETYTSEDYNRFIDADITEFQAAVLETCGEEWAEHILEVEDFNDYPCSVGMNKIYFKIILTNEETGENIQQIISFEIPMGC